MLVKGFKRVNELVSPENLGADELVILENMVLEASESGFNPTKRFGWDIHIPNGSDDIISLHKALNKYWSVQGDKFRKSNGLAWDDVKTVTNGKTRLVAFNDKVIVTNGIDEIFVANGGNWNLEIERMATQTVSVATFNSGGSISFGNYRWLIVYFTETGERGNPSKPFTFFDAKTDILTFPTGSANRASFNGLPTTSDTRITAKRLYRTKANGETFFYVKSIDKNTISFEDGVSDNDLDESDTIEFINIPKAKYITVNNERIFLGNLTKQLKNSVRVPTTSQFTVPIESIDLQDNGSAGIEDGIYRWAYSFIDDKGNESELSDYVEKQFYSEIDYIWAQDNTKVVLNSIARPRIGGGRLDPSIITKKLYRTKNLANNPLEYYYIKDIGLTETTPTDNTPNTLLIQSYPISEKGYFTVENLSSYIVWSEIGKPSEINELNIYAIFPDDGDEITAIVDDRDGVLIFKENSICKLYTTGSPINWRLYKIHKNIGCDEPESFYQQNSVCYFVYNKRPYVFRGGEPQPIGELYKKSFDAVTEFKASTYFTKRDWYVLAVRTDRNLLYIYDAKVETWYKFTITDNDALLDDDDLYIGDGVNMVKYGNVYMDNETGTGVNINCKLRTKTFGFNDGISFGRLRFFYCNLFTNPADINFRIRDNDLNVERTLTLNNLLSKPFTFKKVTDAMNGVLTKFKKLYFEIEGEGIRELFSLKIDYRAVKLEDYPEQQNILIAEEETIIHTEEGSEIEV